MLFLHQLRAQMLSFAPRSPAELTKIQRQRRSYGNIVSLPSLKTKILCQTRFSATVESLSNDDGNINENVAKQWIKLQNTITARANATTWPLFCRRLQKQNVQTSILKFCRERERKSTNHFNLHAAFKKKLLNFHIDTPSGKTKKKRMSYTNKKTENGKLKIQQPSSLTFPSQLLKFPSSDSSDGSDYMELPAAHDSKTINDNGMKFGRVVENHKLITFVLSNWLMTSLLRHNYVITVKIFSFYKNLTNQNKKVWRRF